MARKLSLSKTQRQSAAGMDLIALCTSAGADGRLADEEVAALREWVERYRGVDLPARDHLSTVLSHALTDGVISSAERVTLFEAIETVLPPDVRSYVRDRRRETENLERRRDAAFSTYDFMVAGVRYCNRHVTCRAVSDGDTVLLFRERGNPFSQNATLVLTEGERELGYVPEDDARHLAAQLDSGSLYAAHVKKVLSGGRWPIPVIVADVH